MIFLLDTNVLSQSAKTLPEAGVMAWLKATRESDTCMSVISLVELSSGIELLPVGKKRESLHRWLDSVILTFEQRMLPISLEIATIAGQINATARKAGHTAEFADVILAATAKVHGLKIATLNVRHFKPLDTTIVLF